MGQVQRVVVIGPGGAGKSVLARRLGTACDLPVVHLGRAQLAVLLDLPRGLRHTVDRENLGWAWHWKDRERPAVMVALRRFNGEVVVLTSPTALRRWWGERSP